MNESRKIKVCIVVSSHWAGTFGGAQYQAKLLREEGVVVSQELRIDLDIYLWEGLHLIEIDDILSGQSLS